MSESLSALADKIGLAKRAAARLSKESEAELQAIDTMMEDLTIWTEESTARRDELAAKLKANEERLATLVDVVANREAMEAEYNRRYHSTTQANNNLKRRR